MKEKITIVIVHWNTPDLLNKQLSQLTKNPNHQIIVVDNASNNKITETQKKYSDVKFVFNNCNRGFSAACNQGVILAKHKLILFLNPDISFANNQLSRMISYAKENNLDALSPMVISDDYNKPLPSVLSLLAELTPLKHLIPLFIFKNKTLLGGCLMIKKSVIIEIGGWDERFFLWFEDSDLTKRLLNIKKTIGIFPEIVNHTGGVSLKKMPLSRQKDIFFHSLDVYMQKHSGLIGGLVSKILKKKYSSSHHLLPADNKGMTIVLPNLHPQLLKNFLRKNKQALSNLDKLVVVSSALEKKLLWQLRQEYPLVRFIPLEKNKGFAHTVNIGFKVSRTTWLGTVNDDVVFDKSVIQNILKCRTTQTGSINPIIRTSDGKIESAGIKVLVKGKALPLKTVASKSACFRTDASNAAFVLYRQSALNKVGLFDEKFGSYLEDIDLSLRLKKNGYSNVVSSNAYVTHLGSQTSKSFGKYKRWLDFKNWCLVIIKNWSVKDMLSSAPKIMLERFRNFYGIWK